MLTTWNANNEDPYVASEWMVLSGSSQELLNINNSYDESKTINNEYNGKNAFTHICRLNN